VPVWTIAAIVLAATLLIYAAFVVALILLGRRGDARAVAGFVPDCAIFFGRLLRDSRVPRRHKALLGLLVAYLALPFDLVPTSSRSQASSTTRSSWRLYSEPCSVGVGTA
jgi:hypothetical protein